MNRKGQNILRELAARTGACEKNVLAGSVCVRAFIEMCFDVCVCVWGSSVCARGSYTVSIHPLHGERELHFH